jgi:hypothetical protein
VLAYFKHPQHSSTQKKILYRLVVNKPRTPLEATNATPKKEAPKAANTMKKKKMQCQIAYFQARNERRKASRRMQTLTSTSNSAIDDEQQAETIPPPVLSPHPGFTLPEFFQHLWNLIPATPQVSLPGILGLTIISSTLIQVLLPRIHLSTNRSGTWSPGVLYPTDSGG